MTQRQIVPVSQPDAHLIQLKQTLNQAYAELRELEGDLASEQAAVNRFRMHCKLKLGDWVDQINELRAEQQRLLTHWELHQQAEAAGFEFDEAQWLGGGVDTDQESADIWEATTIVEGDAEPIEDGRTAKKLYRELARKFHPDLAEGVLQKAYSTSMMAVVNDAYTRQDWQALRDLSGEVDPETAAELDKSKHNRQFRKLQRKLRKCKQQQRKAVERRRLLHRERITKLWYQTQQVETAEGENWWDQVAQVLQAEIVEREREIGRLHRRLK